MGHLTILQSLFGPLTKTWKADGTVSDYASGTNYRHRTVEVNSLEDLAQQLTCLEFQQDSCVIRGTRNAVPVDSVLPAYNARRAKKNLRPAVVAADEVLRTNALFDDLPLPWVMIDVDGYGAGDTDHFIQHCLPPAFHGAAYFWQLSATHGHPSRGGTLRVHLWFWLDTPVTGQDLRSQRWPGVDPSTFRRVQPHYTARPIAEPGAPTPPSVRSGLRAGRPSVALQLAEASPRTVADPKPLPADLDVPRVCADLRQALSLVPSDDRATWVKVGCYLQGLGDLGYEIWAEWSAKSPKFDEEGLEDWHTFSADSVDHRAVFELAKDFGWATGAAKVDPSAVFGGIHAAPVTDPPAAVADTSLDAIQMPGTEVALAEGFAAAARGLLIWTPAHGWLVRPTGAAVWEPDDLKKRHALMRAVASAQQMGQAAGVVKTLGKYNTLTAALNEAATNPRLQAPDSAWDANPWELNTPGGVVDLRSGRMRAHSVDDRFLKVTAATPADVATPLWTAFLGRAFKWEADTLEFIQRSVGVWLTGELANGVKTFWYLYGRGDTGKSIITDTVRMLMGPYARVLAPSALVLARSGERHSTDIAMLRGCRMAVTSELPDGEPLNQPLLKALTGEESVPARRMGKDASEVPMRQSHVLSGNHKMRLPGGDPALGRRLLLVVMDQQIPLREQDPLLMQKLVAEWPGILAWAIEGARKWYAAGGGQQGLAVPERVRREGDEYVADENDAAQWIAERCDRDPLARTQMSTAYGSFREWKAERGEPSGGIKTFRSRLETVPGLSFVKASSSFVVGLKLRSGL